MHPSMFEAFQDELIKIAYTHEQLYNMARGDLQMPEANAQKYVQEHQHLITGKPNTQQLSSGGTVAKAPVPTKSHVGPPVPEGTGVVGPPKAPTSTGLTGTHVRPQGTGLSTVNARVPAAATHPVAAPGGFGKMVSKGTAAMKAHAVPLGVGAAVGAGAIGAGALALRHMRNKRDAASR